MKVYVQPMSKLPNPHKRGLIGFFDVLGYKMIQHNNPIGVAISVVETIRKTIENCQGQHSRWSAIFGTNFGDHVVISDSIILFAPFEEDDNDQKQAEMFLPFCGEIVNSLFWEGLPVRGALAYGDFFIQKTGTGIYLAGETIVESHNLANELQLSGCVICQSAEEFLTSLSAFRHSDSILRFIRYPVPLKPERKTKLSKHPFILDQHAFFNPVPQEDVRSKFAAFKKRPADSHAETIIVNTLNFFATRKPGTCQPGGTQ